jgi:hypothetical protein
MNILQTYVTRLFRVHASGCSSIHLEPVPVAVESLDPRFVFVLDTGLKIFMWHGKKSKNTFKSKARYSFLQPGVQFLVWVDISFCHVKIVFWTHPVPCLVCTGDVCTTADQKLSVHFEYLKNRSRGVDVTWQPVIEDLYFVSVNSHSPVGLVSWQWDAIDLACTLCDRRIHNDWAIRSASSWQCTCPFYSSHASFFGKASHHTGLSAPYGPDLAPCDLRFFPKLKSP